MSWGEAMHKNKVEVLIGGKIFSLQGEESKEHIQQVASLINQQMEAIQRGPYGHRLSASQVHMLTALNLADEYLKLKEDFLAYEKELEKCNHENMMLKEKVQEMALEINRSRVNNHLKKVY